MTSKSKRKRRSNGWYTDSSVKYEAAANEDDKQAIANARAALPKRWDDAMGTDILIRMAMDAMLTDKYRAFAILQDVEQRLRKEFFKVAGLDGDKPTRRKALVMPGLAKKVNAVSKAMINGFLENAKKSGLYDDTKPNTVIGIAELLMMQGLTKRSPILVAAAVNILREHIEEHVGDKPWQGKQNS